MYLMAMPVRRLTAYECAEVRTLACSYWHVQTSVAEVWRLKVANVSLFQVDHCICECRSKKFDNNI